MLRPSLENKTVGSNIPSINLSQDINKSILKKLVTDALNATREAKDSDVVLVIGSTGSGKSTAVNYLLGSQMERKRAAKTGKPYITVKAGDKEYAKIGHKNKSETFYPEVFVSKDSSFSYCDCPGFEDNRGLEYLICAAIATQAVINVVKSVKAILIVIEQSAFIEQRGRGFVSVFKTLQGLLVKDGSIKNAPAAKDIAPSLIFLVTKSDPGLNIIELVKEFKESAGPDEATMSYMCDLILQNENNLININPIDNGQSRNAIINRLLQAKRITVELLNAKNALAMAQRNVLDARNSFDLVKQIMTVMKKLENSSVAEFLALHEKAGSLSKVSSTDVVFASSNPDPRLYFRKLLIKTFEATKKAEGQNMFLVIGDESSSRGTVINYLMGGWMKRKKDKKTDEHLISLKNDEKEYHKMNHGLYPHNWYPGIFIPNDSAFSYYDCGDVHEMENSITTIATKIAVNSAKSIQGIIVVMEKSAFFRPQHSGFVGILKTLEELLKHHESKEENQKVKSLMGSIFFAVPKSKSSLNATDFVKLFKLTANRNYPIKGNPDKTTISFKVNLVLQNENNFFTVDPAENNQHRDSIINRLLLSKPISKEFFNFPVDEDIKKKIRDLAKEIAISGIQIFHDYQERLVEIEHKTAAMLVEEKNVDACNEKLKELSLPDLGAKNIISTMQQSINENKTKIEESKAEIAKFENEAKVTITLGAELEKSLTLFLLSVKENTELVVQVYNLRSFDAQSKRKVLMEEINIATEALIKAKREILEKHSSFEWVKKIMVVMKELESTVVTDFLLLYENSKDLIFKLLAESNISQQAATEPSAGYNPRLMSGASTVPQKLIRRTKNDDPSSPGLGL